VTTPTERCHYQNVDGPLNIKVRCRLFVFSADPNKKYCHWHYQLFEREVTDDDTD
jgi:hypothetical protein